MGEDRVTAVDPESAGALLGALALHKIRNVVEDGVRHGHTDVQAGGFGMLVVERFMEPSTIPPAMQEQGQQMCEEMARRFRARCTTSHAEWKRSSEEDGNANQGV